MSTTRSDDAVADAIGMRSFVARRDPHVRPVLALDLGTRVGWAMRTASGISSGAVSFAQGSRESRGDRLNRWSQWLAGMNRDPLAFVAYELVRAHGPGGVLTAHCYGQFEGVLLAWAARAGVDVRPVGVSTVRKAIVGKGNANKQAAETAIRARGFDPASHDEADALAVLLWATGHA